MGTLRNRLLGFIDSSARQAKTLVEDISDSLDRFDWDTSMNSLMETRDSLLKRGNDLLKSFGDLLKQVKDSLNDFSVTVPYDESIGEKLNYEVKDGKLNIEVSFEDETSSRSNTTTVAIPTNCDLQTLRKEVNTSNKTATIIISKKIDATSATASEPEQATDARAEQRRTARARRGQATTPKKPKMKRAANGQFMKAT